MEHKKKIFLLFFECSVSKSTVKREKGPRGIPTFLVAFIFGEGEEVEGAAEVLGFLTRGVCCFFPCSDEGSTDWKAIS